MDDRLDSALLHSRPRAKQVIGNPEGMELWAVEVKAWKSLCSIADEWAAVFARSGGLGEEGCNLATFAAVLEQAARGKKVVKRPARRGDRLLESNRIPGRPLSGSFCVGVHRRKNGPAFSGRIGSFLIRSGSVLRERGLSLPLAEELREHQLLPFFFCAVAATEKLVFSYSSASPEGKGQVASPYLQELLQVFGKRGFRSGRGASEIVCPCFGKIALFSCRGRKEPSLPRPPAGRNLMFWQRGFYIAYARILPHGLTLSRQGSGQKENGGAKVSPSLME